MSRPLDTAIVPAPSMKPPRIWITLGEAAEAARFEDALEAEGLAVAAFEPADADELELVREGCDAWIVDPRACAGDPYTLLAAHSNGPAVLVLAAFGTIADAVEAMRRGAADYLTRPVTNDRLIVALKRALESRNLRRENERLHESLLDRFDLGRIVSRDPRMLEIKHLVESVADTRAHLLISGESGTGKTLLARAIHQRSSRAHEAFVEVNCGALPASLLESELFGHARGAFTGALKDKLGRFETADGGTIFLDEIATAPLELQVKLLRVIQDKLFERVGESETRSVDVRVIAASNRELRAEVEAGRFREDLYWRLAVIPIHLPPLRERPKDIALLAETFLARFAAEYGRPIERMSSDALAALCRAPWPGNVRQLENTLERAVLLARGRELAVEDLGAELLRELENERIAPKPPLAPRAIGNLKQALAEPERDLILRALEANGGNRKRTAEMLGVNRTTLFNKMRKHGLLGLEPEPRPATPSPGQTPSHPAL